MREGEWDGSPSSPTGGGHPRWPYRLWTPSPIRAGLLVIHGFGEHGGRYQPLAEALAGAGIAVLVPDLPGHGRSQGLRGDIADVAQCADELSRLAEHTLQPVAGRASVAVFGHSFGGLVAIALALQHPERVSRLVVQSPLLEVGFPLPRWKATLASLLACCWPTASLPMHVDAQWLSRDPAVGRAYRADPLVHNLMSARSYRSILHTRDDAFERAGSLRSPTLVLSGGADRIVSLEAIRRWYGRLTCEKRAVEFLGAYHELHHEPIRDEALRLIHAWVLGSPGAIAP